MTDASQVYFQIRELLFLANGFPSWIIPIEAPFRVDRIRDDELLFCGWVYDNTSYALGFDYEDGLYRVIYNANSTIISEEMFSVVKGYANDDKNAKALKDKEWEEKAQSLF